MTWRPDGRDGDIYMTYMRNDHKMTVVLPMEPDFIIYNPMQVDQAYRKASKTHTLTKGTDRRFFLFTNLEDLGLPEVPMEEGDPVARVPEFPPYDQCGFSYDE